MNKKLHILHLEDNRNDAELIKETLAAGGTECDIMLVDNRDDFMAVLEREQFDLILADYNLPAFDGLSALEIASARRHAAPFLFVTGTMGEEIAVDSLRHGATDYIVKSNLARLVPAVKRALHEKEVRIARERAEKALSESEDRYRSLFNNSMDAVLLTVPDGRTLSANPAACQMFGRTEEEICAIGRDGLIAPDDPGLAKLLEERERTGRASGELTFTRKDGTRFPGEVSSLLFKDSQGALRTSMVIRDITDRKQKEEELQKLNRTLQAKSRSSLAMMRTMDEQLYLSEVCRIIVEDCGHALVWIGFANDDEQKTVNPVAHAGFEAGYLESMKITWADTERGRGPVGTAIRTGKPVVFRSTTANSRFEPWRHEAHKRGYAAVVSIPLQAEEKTFGALNIYSRQQDPFSEDEVRLLSDLAADLSYGIAAIRQRSAQRLAEDALRASEAKFRHLVENLGMEYFFYRQDAKGVLTYVSPSVTDMLGYLPQEIASHYSGHLTENPINREVAHHTDLSLRGVRQPPYLMEVFHKDGSARWLEVSEFPVRDESGSVVAVEGIARDITERLATEEREKQASRKWQATFDAIGDAVCLLDLDGTILQCNKAMADYLGKPAGEVTGGTCWELMHGSSGPIEGNPVERMKSTLQREQQELQLNGKWISITADPIMDESGKLTGTVHITSDVSERKKLEAQLLHAQKMEAIGTLAGGIAHDFNNILNVIIGYGGMVLEEMDADNPSWERMREVLAAADRAANLTKRLLMFSRKEVVDFRHIHVNDVVSGIDKFFTRIIGEDIVLSIELADTDAMIFADAGQLEQVLMNLVTNARDAMTRGGCLTISTGSEEIDGEFIAVHGYGTAGKYASISVADTGVGMNAETQGKIFEPFYTTKGVGEGTGLGLSIAYGIIKQHKGFIQVYSEVGKGTLFKILLPLSEKAASEHPAADTSEPQGGTETILIAEDEAPLRDLLRIILESFGYAVLAAGDGEEAVRMFLEHRDRIRLVILDMIMPNKSGKDAADEIENAQPGVRILFMSGYSDDMIKKQGLTEEGFVYIQKPVSAKLLLRRVRELLDV